MVERKLTNVPLEQPEKKMTHDEYLELPDVKARDDAEIGRIKEAREHGEAMERKIDAEYNAQFVKAREEKEKLMKDFRDSVMEIVWNHTTVGNCPRGEWAPEYYISKKDEAEFDGEMNAALVLLLARMKVV